MDYQQLLMETKVVTSQTFSLALISLQTGNESDQALGLPE
jgi:hypothetical protein